MFSGDEPNVVTKFRTLHEVVSDRVRDFKGTGAVIDKLDPARDPGDVPDDLDVEDDRHVHQLLMYITTGTAQILVRGSTRNVMNPDGTIARTSSSRWAK